MNTSENRSHREQLERDDQRYLWHPFTQMQGWLEQPPLIIERGEGNELIDMEGNHYLDGVSSLWVTVHGHGRPELKRAVAAQMERLDHSTFLGLSHPPGIELARRLVELAPGELSRVFYSDTGSAAVEIALKMAFQYWQQRRIDPRPRKTKFLSLSNGYHGDTIGAVSVGGIDLFHATYRPLLFPTVRAESAYCYRCPIGLQYPSCAMACLEDVERALKEHHEELAALIMEPLNQGAGGMIVFPPGYTRAVWELARRYDVLFIADEVATGFGRTGSMFACEQEGVEPDLMAVGKGISGGYLPLAATLATEEIFEAFLGVVEEGRTFYHGHTYTGNPLACAAALANLDIFEQEGTIAAVAPKVEAMTAGLRRFRDLPHVGDVRQAGLMVGIELVRDRDTREPYPATDRIGMRVIEETRRRGIILRPLSDVIVLMPPLSITGDELTRLLDVTYEAIRTVTEGTGGNEE